MIYELIGIFIICSGSVFAALTVFGWTKKNAAAKSFVCGGIVLLIFMFSEFVINIAWLAFIWMLIAAAATFIVLSAAGQMKAGSTLILTIMQSGLFMIIWQTGQTARMISNDWIAEISGEAVAALVVSIAAVFYHSRLMIDNEHMEIVLMTKKDDARIHPVFTLLFISIGLLLAEFYIIYFENTDLAVAGLLLSAALFICLLAWISLIARYYASNREVDMNAEYMKEMQSFLKTIRSQRHDFNFHVHVLDGLMRRGEYKKCSDYLDSLCADTEAINSLIPISDMAIAALINNYREMCLKRRIPIDLDIQDDMSCIVCTVYEANKILGNLLQNAYDEADAQSGGNTSYGIHLSIFKRSGMTTIRISNKVRDVNKIVDICEFGHTGKSGHDGIGINNIMQIVDRYEGVFYWEIEDKDIISFIVKIPNSVG